MSRVDLRSDTLTQPTAEMYEALRTAPLGDDVFGDDPTVNALEAEAAELLGKESALFLPSGTMGNSVAIAAQTQPGDEMLLLEDSHIHNFEQGGAARLWGVTSRVVPSDQGALTIEQIDHWVKPDDAHFTRTRLVCLENTHNLQGGVVVAPTRIRSLAEHARAHGLRVHLDGARLWNAAVAEGLPVRVFVEAVDSVMVSLTKGLRCPAGCLLAGEASLIESARRVRKVLGGGMRQTGILAACGRVALKTGLPQLGRDHELAQSISRLLGSLDGVEVSPPPQTNIIYVRLPGRDLPSAVENLASRDVYVINIMNQRLRLVTHADLPLDTAERVFDAFRTLLS